MRYVLSLIAFTLIPLVAMAQEYGKFHGNPVGEFVADSDRPKFRLNAPFVFEDPNGMIWEAPAGEVVDGASIPGWAWSLVGGPFSGNYLNAAIVHDYFCCTKSREYHSTHNTFWLGMKSAGVSDAMAWTFWAAVRMGGPDYWSVGQQATPPAPCKTVGSLSASLIDRLDEQPRAIAAAKFAGIARTLKTTNGRLLDIVDGREILPGTTEAEAHLTFLHEAALKNFDVAQERLGLLSVITPEEMLSFDSGSPFLISGWVRGQIPELDAYMAAEKITFPESLRIDGELYAPYVAHDKFDIKINDFAEEFRSLSTP